MSWIYHRTISSMSLFLFILLIGFLQLGAHPICLDESNPQHRSGREKFIICKQFEYYGCCNAEQEARIYERYVRMLNEGVSQDCGDMLKEMLCQECSPLAGHIYLTKQYGRTGRPDLPGLCPSLCSTFYNKCFSSIPFKTTSKEEFCKDIAAEDEYYCYPEFDVNASEGKQQKRTPGCIKMCLEEVANRIYQPIAAKSPNDGTNRFFVVEQRGYAWTYLSNMSKISHPPFLNITDRIAVDIDKYDEKGFIDLTLHPDFENNGLLYVYYTIYKARKLHTRISQFKISEEDMNMVDPDTEKIILEIQQDTGKHNGGSLLFGEDGYLYISTGDGGVLSESRNRGQDMSVLLGKMLRIDVNVNDYVSVYKVPPDNPFVGQPGIRPEIYSTGLRNPWRCTLDQGEALTGNNRGRMFCGDVGSSQYEEIDFIKKAENYGWRITEGFHCSPKSVPGECREEIFGNYTFPIAEYSHRIMDCIIGGYVYRGCRNPALRGLYLSAGLKRGGLRAIRETYDGKWEHQTMCMQKDRICKEKGLTNKLPFNILSFAEDNDGELYLLTTNTPGPGFSGGKIFKIIHTPNRKEREVCSPSKPYKATVILPRATIENYEPIPDIEFQLVVKNKSKKKEGRVEIRKEGGEWGTVCGRSLSPQVSKVLCIMAMHRPTSSRLVTNTTIYGTGTGPIWLSNLNCIGHEETLLNCYHSGWGNVGNCTHEEDISVVCGSKRL